MLCVDSDFDYIIGKEILDADHFILQTYTYSWENHYCWHEALQTKWLQWENGIGFDFSVFLPALSSLIYDSFVLMLTKKRLSHKGFTLRDFCNVIDKVQGNRKEGLVNNGEGILSVIKHNINQKISIAEPETQVDTQTTIRRLNEVGVGRTNCYLYIQGHSIFNLVNRIGRALLGTSFEYQVLMQSFSIYNDYHELELVRADVEKVL